MSEPALQIDKLTEGWAKPTNSNNYHYFKGRLSLCNRWTWRGIISLADQGLYSHPEYCNKCRKRALR